MSKLEAKEDEGSPFASGAGGPSTSSATGGGGENGKGGAGEATTSSSKSSSSSSATSTTGASANGGPAGSGPPYLAKVYRLGENDKEWQDCGVVRVRCSFVERLGELAMVLVSDEDASRTVLETPLSRCEYRREVPTIISWADSLDLFHPLIAGSSTAPTASSNGTNDPSAIQEVALSFETSEGCARIWEEVCAGQGKVSSDFRVDAFKHGDGDDGMFDSSFVSHGSDEGGMGGHHSTQLITFPPVTRENLDQIARLLKACVGPSQRNRIAAELVSPPTSEKFTLRGLLDLYDELEQSTDEKRQQDLEHMFEIIKFVALLDDQKVFELMLRDECFIRIAGALENDPNMSYKPQHRKFLQDEAKFNQVVPITNEAVTTMISQRFRLGFLRDVLLPRVLDESSFKRLNTMDIKLSADIATALHQDDDFVSQLIAVLDTPASDRRAKAIAFLSELSSLTQKMQIQQRNAFYRTFTETRRDLLPICERILADPASTAREKLDVGEIILLALKHDTNVVRKHITEREAEIATKGPSSATSSSVHLNGGGDHVRQDSKPATKLEQESLMGLLVDRIISDEDAGVQAQACQLLEILLDPESLTAASNKEDDPCITIFYSRYAERLIHAFDELGPEARHKYKDEETPLNAAQYICRLFAFCVQTHGYVVREVIANHVIVPKILRLLDCKEKHLVLDAIRFVRTCIGMKESFYIDYFIQNNLFQPLIRAFARNGSKNNLLNSAVIDLLEFIKSEKIMALVDHLVTNFANDLRPIGAYVSTFTELERLSAIGQNGSGLGTSMRSPSTQSLPSMPSPGSAGASGDHIRRPNGSLRVTAAIGRNNIFGEMRPFRGDDDDEALFEDDASPSIPALVGGADENSPSKRMRIEVALVDPDLPMHHSRAQPSHNRDVEAASSNRS